MSDELNLDNRVEMENTVVIANAIEVAVEVMCSINPDLIEVGNSAEAREDLAEAFGAALYANVIKESGV